MLSAEVEGTRQGWVLYTIRRQGRNLRALLGNPQKHPFNFLWWHLVSLEKKRPSSCLGVGWGCQHSGSQLDEQDWDLILQDVDFLLGPLFLIQWLSYILLFLMSPSLEPM